MKTLYKLICILLCVFILIPLSACNERLNSAIVYFELTTPPNTLDPQTASTNEELMIVRNIFEGLLRENEKGEIVAGVAESYKKQGLDYTFNLKENAVWSDGTPLTADDFAFGLRRAVQKDTKSPFVKRLFAIKNAEQINKGNLPASSLGVKVIDKNTLLITLSKDDKNFLKTLTTSVAMPCNEAFFNSCKGQYGIKNNYIISNGSYSITKWNREDFGIRIYRNKSYEGSFTAKNGAVFFSKQKDESTADRLLSNKSDIAFIENSDIDKFSSEDFSTAVTQNICWVMTISGKFSPNMRRAFAELCDETVYKDKLKSGFTSANSLFPSSLTKSENCEKVGKTSYNPKSALKLYSAAIMSYDDKKLPPTTLTYYDNEAIKPIITAIVGHWQQNLSAFINIRPYENSEELLPQLKNPTLDMSVFPINITSDYIEEYLQNYGINYKGESLAKLQKELLKSNKIIPIAFENTNIVYSNTLTNVYCDNENGYIDFSYIIKED